MSGKRSGPAAYFPAVEGLRALAVVGVVLYHVGALMPGGFVGVDIFFVISGFVVAHSAANLPAESFGHFVASFYARRLIRIAPALVACLLVTALITTLLVPKAWLSDSNAKVGLGAFFGISNLVLIWTADGYWSPRTEFNPFTHTWSLGVEEQFYFIFPALYFAWRTGHKRLAGMLLLGLILLTLIAAVWTKSNVVAFFSLHTRFWELGVGVFLSFTLGIWAPAIARWRTWSFNVLSVASALGLGASLILVRSDAFPWPGALLPVASAAGAIVIAAAAPRSWFAQILSLKPVVIVGRGSYSLYLWHWPVFVLTRWTTGLDSTLEMVLAVGISGLLAAGSYLFIEKVFRTADFVRRIRRIAVVAVGVGALFVSSGMAAAIFFSQQWISLSVTKEEAVWNPGARLPLAEAACGLGYESQALAGGRVMVMSAQGCTRSARTLFILGDSHAWAFTPLAGMPTQRDGWTSHVLSKPGCQFAGLRIPMNDGPADCQRFSAAALDWIRSRVQPGDVVFLPGLRVDRLRDQWGRANAPVEGIARPEVASDEAVSLLTPLAARGARIVFELPKPVFRVPPFRCSDWFNASNPVCEGGATEPRSDQERHRAEAVASLRAVAGRIPNATLWDPFPVLCPGTVCSAFQDGKPLFFDGDQLSAYGNLLLWPSFRTQVILKP